MENVAVATVAPPVGDPKKEVYDVHALRNAKGFVLKLASQVIDAEKNDGKVSAVEAIKMALADVPDFVRLVRDRKEAVLEVKDISLEELQEMGAWVPELLAAVMHLLAVSGFRVA